MSTFGTIPRAQREAGLRPKQAGGYFSRLQRDHRSRYRITFSIKGSLGKYGAHDRYGRPVYVKGAWPILFKTENDAWDAIAILGAFKNDGATDARGRIISCAVERIEISGGRL